MPQIALNIDETTFEKIENIAKQRKISMSNWVESNIKNILQNDYPDGFFDLFGAIKDDTFLEPKEIDYRYNIQREQI
ncbi:MAG: hypothetical protein LBV69_10315 [Bacteroidales bacterium]|jgi:hypothetical protein|nr:hypothetical protein [Bacteroidales bacterium]